MNKIGTLCNFVSRHKLRCGNIDEGGLKNRSSVFHLKGNREQKKYIQATLS